MQKTISLLRKQSKLIGLGLLLGVQVVAWGLLVSKLHQKPKTAIVTKRASSQCTQSDTSCQQELHYKTLTEQHGVPAAFKELRAAYATDASIRAYCHPLTHVIGRVAGEKAKTVSAAYAQGDEFCWSGYYHGVMEAMLSKIDPQTVLTQLNGICADLRQQKPSSFDHYNCVHGLGHGLMLISGHELFTSLTSCDQLNDNWERSSCYGGVFMENIMASINPNHKTKYIHADQPLYPCTAVKELYKQQCYLMQTSHALTSLNDDFAKVFALCSSVEKQHQATCYQSLGRDASGRSISDPVVTRTTCMLGGNFEARSNCIIGAVKDFVAYYRSDTQAKVFCDSLEAGLKNICVSTAEDYYQTF